jgi:PAS domain S-box-containing protein
MSPRSQVEADARLPVEEASARLAAVVESSIDGILTKDLTGRITSWNPACETLFGYTAEEMLGRPITMLYPKGKEGEEETILERIRTGQPVRIHEAQRVRKDGSTIWVSVSASPLRDASGKIVGAAAIKRDVTEARIAEKERVEAKARFQEFKRLQAVNQFKSQFINTAAHELRTPLLPLRMQLELLMTDEDNPPLPSQVDAMGVMRRNLDRLGALVEDLLTVARSQAGRIQFDIAPTDLANVLREAEQTFETMAARRGIRLDVDYGSVSPIVADGKRIGQVVTNLLSNAFKFTPDGGEVRVTLRPQGHGARVTVADSGIGIAPADVPRLFQPFVQVHDATQVTQPGSGLGLYICRQLVELHGGTIGCESPGRGHGATFWFTLPGIPFRPASDENTEWNPTS